MRKFGFVISLIFISFLYSCATIHTMALNEKQLELTNNALALMTIKTENQFKPDVQFNFNYLYAKSKKTKKIDTFQLDEPYKKVENKCHEYLVSIQLPPDEYEFIQILGDTGGYSRVGLDIPLNLFFTIDSNNIFYLGHIEVISREKKNDKEHNVGSTGVAILSPIQGAMGASLGLYKTTFDIKIYDNYENDIAIFKEKYPFLSNQKIEKRILPKWIRPEERDTE